MGLVKEFREFAVKGNVIDLAVGVIIGGAFGKIVTSLVSDIVMPPIGVLLGKVEFSNLYLSLTDKVPSGLPLADARKLGPVLAYGNFLDATAQFVILAFVIFLTVKAINRLRKDDAAPAAPPTPPEDVQLLTEIRDLLGAKG